MPSRSKSRSRSRSRSPCKFGRRKISPKTCLKNKRRRTSKSKSRSKSRSRSPCKFGRRKISPKTCLKNPRRHSSKSRSKSRAKMAENQFYCVGCRKRVYSADEDICVTVYKNKINPEGETGALRSQCYECGTNLTKFVKNSAIDRLANKYGDC